MPIDEIIFCDTGKEFPAMYQHIAKFEQCIGMPITVLKPEKSFDYWMFEHIKTKGGTLNKIGYGWPLLRHVRWCTDHMKQAPIKKYLKKYGNDYIEYVGYSFDEPKRVLKDMGKNMVFPLFDWKVTEAMALKYCYDRGFDWGGLYTHFNRVSCWCCPFTPIAELRKLYYFYPEIWEELREMDARSFNSFSNRYTLDELELRFKNELIS